MKTLIFVRHGEYDYNYRLTEAGRHKLRALAEALKPEIEGRGEVLVLASTAPRAADSADVICEVLAVSRRENHEVLWEDDSHFREIDEDLNLVRSRADDADVVIVVGHLPHQYLLTAYARVALGARFNPDLPDTGKGEGQILDCVEKTLKVLK